MKNEKGQSLVEFALVLPILIFLLFGIVDFGRVFHAYLTIDHAGREAARAVSIGKNDDAVKLIATSNGVGIGLTTSQIEINPPAPSTGKRQSGTDATIKITFPITFLTPVIGDLVGSLTLTDTTTMRVE